MQEDKKSSKLNSWDLNLDWEMNNLKDWAEDLPPLQSGNEAGENGSHNQTVEGTNCYEEKS